MADRFRLLRLGESDHVAGIVHGEAFRPEIARQRPAGGMRLDAADLAAAAKRLPAPLELNVTDIAGRPLRTAIDPSIGEDAAADFGSRLDEDELVDLRPVTMVLGERKQIDIVVGEYRTVEMFAEPAGNVEIVPPAHDRGTDDAAGIVVDRRRQADPDAENLVLDPADLLDELTHPGCDPRQDRDRAAIDVDRVDAVGDDPRGEIRRRRTDMGLADIRREHNAEIGIEAKDARRPAAARERLIDFADHAGIEKHGQSLAHGRSRQTARPGDRRARARPTGCDQGEDVSDACHDASISASRISAYRYVQFRT